MNEVIEGTRFLPFKTPYHTSVKSMISGDMESFNGSDLLNKVANLGIVFNLVLTDRYYNIGVYKGKQVEVCRVRLKGGGRVPEDAEITSVFGAMDNYILRNREDRSKLVGVHCTHGVNRTGYLICRYMITKLGFEPADAIKKFEEGRGHPFDHEEYVEALLKLTPREDPVFKAWHSVGGEIIPAPKINDVDFDPDELYQFRMSGGAPPSR